MEEYKRKLSGRIFGEHPFLEKNAEFNGWDLLFNNGVIRFTVAGLTTRQLLLVGNAFVKMAATGDSDMIRFSNQDGDKLELSRWFLLKTGLVLLGKYAKLELQGLRNAK